MSWLPGWLAPGVVGFLLGLVVSGLVRAVRARRELGRRRELAHLRRLRVREGGQTILDMSGAQLSAFLERFRRP